jgi:hypothetical protein
VLSWRQAGLTFSPGAFFLNLIKDGTVILIYRGKSLSFPASYPEDATGSADCDKPLPDLMLMKTPPLLKMRVCLMSLLAVAAGLSSCTLGPDFKLPDLKLGKGWRSQADVSDLPRPGPWRVWRPRVP